MLSLCQFKTGYISPPIQDFVGSNASFIHSFRAFFKSATRPTQKRSRHSTGTCTGVSRRSEIGNLPNVHTVPYVATRAGFEPTTTLRSKGIDFYNAPPCPLVGLIVRFYK